MRNTTLAAIAAALLAGCQPAATPLPQIDPTEQAAEDGRQGEIVRQIFYNVPSPIEMTSLLRKTGATFDPAQLSRHSREGEFLTQDHQALNLGVYGADLCCCRLFDQNQATLNYLGSIRALTLQLQIPEQTASDPIQRLEANIGDKDSIIAIVADMFSDTDAYLKENQRHGAAALVLAGGWAESMYLATHLRHNPANAEALRQTIAAQKHTAANMPKLLAPHLEESPTRKAVHDRLLKISTVFDRVTHDHPNNDISHFPAERKTVLNAAGAYHIDPATLQELQAAFADLRSYIVKE